jgi:Flp pilus assembly protein TadG
MTLDATVALLTWFRRHLSRVWGNEAGNTAIMLGLCLLPTIGLIGLGVDYWSGLSNKARLDAAADSAALAAITAAQAYYNANIQTQPDPALTSGAKAAGEAQGYKAFPVNAGAAVTRTSATPTINVTRKGQSFTAAVSYKAKLPTAFGKLFGTTNFNIGGSSGSSLTMGSYLDFYLLLDVSGSMGLATSPQGQTALADLNPDASGCAFACHFAGMKSYDAAKKKHITLRVNSVASAVTNLISTATSTQTLTHQYRVGIYPFIVNLMEAAPISYNFTQATATANSLADSYLDQGLSNPATTAMGSGGTHFENVLPGINNYVKSPGGDGSSPQKAKTFLFIVTDGADDNQVYYGNGNWSGPQPQRPNNFGYCQYAQQLGVTISILYIPYVPIQPARAGEDTQVNAVIPFIPDDLKACATPGFFFTANSDADINNAMQAMFAQALQAARLTN